MTRRAAALRNVAIPFLLAKAYPEIQNLIAYEAAFRLYVLSYGGVLSGGVEPMAMGVKALVQLDYGVLLTIEQSIELLAISMKVISIVPVTYMEAVAETIEILAGIMAPPRLNQTTASTCSNP